MKGHQEDIKQPPAMHGSNGTDISRRSFSRISAVAPVLMSLASPSVLGATCLSNMMSGNLSNPDDGQCSFGWSPGGWKNPVGQVNGMGTLQAWSAAGYDYGTLDGNGNPDCEKNNGTFKNKAECYSGGSLYSSTLLNAANPDSRTLREILIEDSGSEKWHCIAALLNASSPGFTYILTVDQVVGLCNGSIPVPEGYSSLNAFLDSTWI